MENHCNLFVPDIAIGEEFHVKYFKYTAFAVKKCFNYLDLSFLTHSPLGYDKLAVNILVSTLNTIFMSGHLSDDSIQAYYIYSNQYGLLNYFVSEKYW